MSDARTEVATVAVVRRMLRDGTGRRLRQAANLSLGDLARAVPCDQAALSKYELGQRMPRAVTALRYAEALAELLDLVGLPQGETVLSDDLEVSIVT